MLKKLSLRAHLNSAWRWLSDSPWGLAFAAGCLLVLCAPGRQLFPLLLLYPICLQRILERLRSTKESFLVGFVISLVVMWGIFYWVTYVIHIFGHLHWGLTIPIYLLFCGFGALHLPLFVVALFLSARRARLAKASPHRIFNFWIFFAPALYTVIEYVIPQLFPWYLGHGLYWLPLTIQIVEWTGLTFLTFLIFQTGSAVGLLWSNQLNRRQKQIAIALPLTFWILTLAVGSFRLYGPQPERTPLKVSMVQANIGSLEKFAAYHGFLDGARRIFDVYRRLTDRVVREEHPDIVLWPETAVPFEIRGDSLQAEEFRQAIRGWGTQLVTGGYDIVRTAQFTDYNSAFLIDPLPSGVLRLDAYHKNVLLAFGEYMPLGEWFPKLYEWFPTVAQFGRGHDQAPLTLRGGQRVGVTICYEAILPQFVRKVANHPIQALLNLTNDSWFGPTEEPLQHAAISLFRSVETRLPMLRVTNTGISLTVDDRGRMGRRTPIYEEALLTETVQLPTVPPRTFYTRFGDWFLIPCLGIILIFLSRRRHAPPSP